MTGDFWDIYAQAAAIERAARVPVCRDFDGDCADVPDKVHCFLYDPAKGRCPYLSTEGLNDE